MSRGPGYARPIESPSVAILTPVKQAADHLDRYFELLWQLQYPAEQLSLGMIVSDSTDETWDELERRRLELERHFSRVTLTRRDFGFQIPDGVPRWAPPFQIPRRKVLAMSRNHLLFAALRDEDWVLWLDVDVCDYPPDIITRLLATGKDIVHPHCVVEPGGQTFDLNAWRNQGLQRMDSLRGQTLVRLDAVGGTMLLVRADVHRAGLVFPPFLYGRENRFARRQSPLDPSGVGEIETEGLALMAKDMGVECWGLPDLEIVHA